MAAVWAAGPDPMTTKKGQYNIPVKKRKQTQKLCRGKKKKKKALLNPERVDIPTTLLCMVLALRFTGSSGGGGDDVAGFFWRVVAAAAIDSPALERSVRRRVEANSLAACLDIFFEKRA